MTVEPVVATVEGASMPPWLQAPWDAFHLETDPRLRLAELHHLAEVCTRVVVALGRTELEAQGRSLATAHAEYARAVLQRPSFGNWIDMARHVALALPTGRLRDAAEGVAALAQGDEDLVLSLRNRIAHGQRPNVDEAHAHVNRQWGTVLALALALERAVAGTKLTPSGDGPDIYACRWEGPSGDLKVVPLLAFHGTTPLSFKSLDERRVEYIGPGTLVRMTEAPAIEAFRSRLALNDDAMTRSMLATRCIGRDDELKLMRDQLVMTAGRTHVLVGTPKSGKSALLAGLGRMHLTGETASSLGRPEVFYHRFDPGDVHAFLTRLCNRLGLGPHHDHRAEACAKVLRAANDGWLILVDDVDALDAATRTTWWRATAPLRARTTWAIATQDTHWLEGTPVHALLANGVPALRHEQVAGLLLDHLIHAPTALADWDAAALRELTSRVLANSGGAPLYVTLVGRALQAMPAPRGAIAEGFFDRLPASVADAYAQQFKSQRISDAHTDVHAVIGLLAAQSAPLDTCTVRAVLAWQDARGNENDYAADLAQGRDLKDALEHLRHHFVYVDVPTVGVERLPDDRRDFTLRLREQAMRAYLEEAPSIGRVVKIARRDLRTLARDGAPRDARTRDHPDHRALERWLWQHGPDLVQGDADALSSFLTRSARPDAFIDAARARVHELKDEALYAASAQFREEALELLHRLDRLGASAAQLHVVRKMFEVVREGASRYQRPIYVVLGHASAALGDDETWTRHLTEQLETFTDQDRADTLLDAARVLAVLRRQRVAARQDTRMEDLVARMRALLADLAASGEPRNTAIAHNYLGQTAHEAARATTDPAKRSACLAQSAHDFEAALATLAHLEPAAHFDRAHAIVLHNAAKVAREQEETTTGSARTQRANALLLRARTVMERALGNERTTPEPTWAWTNSRALPYLRILADLDADEADRQAVTWLQAAGVLRADGTVDAGVLATRDGRALDGLRAWRDHHDR